MHITIVEDEILLGNKMLTKLKTQGYEVSIFTSYHEFMSHGNSKSHLYVIDIGLGDGSGFDIIEWLRKKEYSVAPIIITSGYGDTDRIVYGLTIGADDYMVKPCIPDEFVARVDALARRNIRNIQNSETMKRFTYKDFTYIPDTQEILHGKNNVFLSKKEMMIFELFIRNPEKIISREDIIEHAWSTHDSMDVSDIVLNTALSRIRKKFNDKLDIRGVYGFGYILQ